jgi:hypothetical protein
MAAKNVDIKISTTASGNGAQQTAAQMDKLAASSTKAATATNTVTASTSNLGARAGAVGLQIQDIAVQAQMGTNAVTILAQQGTQIASIFGPQGAIIGALLAVGAVATQVFLKMGDDTQSAKEKADFLAGAIEKIGEEAGKIKSEEIDMGRDAITRAIELTGILAEGFKAASDQEREFSAQATENVNRLRLAEIELRKARGEITDEAASMQSQEVAQERILQKAKQQQEAERAKADESRQAVEIAREELATRGRSLVMKQEELDLLIKQADQLREQKKETLEAIKIANEAEDRALGPVAGRINAFFREKPDTPLLDAQINALNEQIESLARATGSSGALYKDLIQAAEGLQNAEIAAQNVSATVVKQVEQIALQAETDVVLQNAQVATENARNSAKEISEQVASIEAITPIQQQAKAEIEKALQDGKVTAEEQVKIGQNLSILLSSLQAGQTSQIGTLQELIRLNNDMALQMQSANQEIRALRTKVQALQGVR